MQPDSALSAAYFETPVRAERKLLLQHLLRNASGIIYLRAPAGAGKTLFAERLIREIGDDRASVWIRAELDRDIAASTAKQLGLGGDAATAWPEKALSQIGDRDLLLVVDDADRLAEPAVSQIASLRAAACPVLLLGEGGLPVASAAWDVQFVDLPPFTPEQSAAFVRSQAGGAPGRINDELAALLHETAQGWPGPLLSALREVMAKSVGGQRAKTTESAQGNRPIWPWLAGGGAAVLLGVVLFYQDAINALFEPPSTVDQRPSITPAPLPFPRGAARAGAASRFSAVEQAACPDADYRPTRALGDASRGGPTGRPRRPNDPKAAHPPRWRYAAGGRRICCRATGKHGDAARADTETLAASSIGRGGAPATCRVTADGGGRGRTPAKT